MDPNAALQDIRDAIGAYEGGPDRRRPAATLRELIEKFEALDQWLGNGGFLPQAWTPAVAKSRMFNVNGSITTTNGTGWTSTRTTPTLVVDSAIQGALTPDAAIDIFIDLIQHTHAIDDSDLVLSIVATDRESDAVATREHRFTF